MNETKNPLWVDSPWIDSENNLTFITDSDGEIWVMGTDPSNPEISIPYSEYTRLRIEGLELANSKDLTFDLKALDAYNEANVNEVVISSGTTEWTLTPDSEYEIISSSDDSIEWTSLMAMRDESGEYVVDQVSREYVHIKDIEVVLMTEEGLITYILKSHDGLSDLAYYSLYGVERPQQEQTNNENIMNTSGTIGLIVALVIVAIYWAPMAKRILGNLWKYIDDKKFKRKLYFPMIGINSNEDKSSYFTGIFVFGVLIPVVFVLLLVAVANLSLFIIPAIASVVGVFFIPRALRFLMRSKKAIDIIGKVAHKHVGDKIENVDPGKTDY